MLNEIDLINFCELVRPTYITSNDCFLQVSGIMDGSAIVALIMTSLRYDSDLKLFQNYPRPQESLLKSAPRPLHRSKDDGNLLRPARPLPLQRGLLHPGEAAAGLLAAEDRHHLGSSACAQPGAASEAAPLLAVSPLLPSILLAKQVPGHRIIRQIKSRLTFRDPRYSSLPWSCPRPPGPEPLPLLQASQLVYQVVASLWHKVKNFCAFQPRPTSFQQRRSVPNIKFSMARSHLINQSQFDFIALEVSLLPMRISLFQL